MNTKPLKIAVLSAALVLLATPALARIGATVVAGFSELPLRTCEGVTAGIVKTLPKGTPMKILWDNKNNWAEVDAGGQKGWVNLENTGR